MYYLFHTLLHKEKYRLHRVYKNRDILINLEEIIPFLTTFALQQGGRQLFLQDPVMLTTSGVLCRKRLFSLNKRSMLWKRIKQERLGSVKLSLKRARAALLARSRATALLRLKNSCHVFARSLHLSAPCHLLLEFFGSYTCSLSGALR